MQDSSLDVTKQLLQINTIKIQAENPFTWASGWKSPIYCDNRKILSYPEARTLVAKSFANLVRKMYPEAEVIAGVATGAIAHGVLVAELLGLPFIYVRSAPKGHGLENMIEGDLKAGQKVVIIEDLVSTGMSSLKAAEAVREAGKADILGMLAIFTYGFPVATEAFSKAGIKLDTLSDYNLLIEHAVNTKVVAESQVESLKSWRENPAEWGR